MGGTGPKRDPGDHREGWEMVTFACMQCLPGCTIETDDDDIRPPERCPWKGDIDAVWEGCE